MTLPNCITIFRLLLIPVFVYFAGRYGQSVRDGAPEEWLRLTAVWVFLVAAISDFADGYIARRWNLRSRLGSVLDPLADKGLMFSAIITLTVTGWSEQHRFPVWFPVLAILRDVLSALGAWAIHLKHGRVRVSPHWTGKACNVAQIVAIAWVMLRLEFIHPIVATTVAAVFIVISGAFHLWDGAVQFIKGPHPETSVPTDRTMQYLTWQECLAAKPFTQIIDVRSPAEFATDRIPGAINLPVLSNAERAEVGTLYVQGSRFAARRLGAAMVARNVAAHLEEFFAPFPEHSRFLLYCWRGGQRSKAMGTILHAVGWNISIISSGYKGYRAHVREALEKLCPQLHCRLLGGLTGSGKTRILRAMSAQGRQVLDLESVGRHRGSLLGDEPGAAQPSQKYFESLLLQQMECFDLTKPVWLEAESKRLGRLWLPEPLWQAMLRAQVHEIHVPAEVRAGFLLREYPHFTSDPETLIAKLETLREACGGKRLAAWAAFIRSGEWPAFVHSILLHHYDPVYLRNRRFSASVADHSAEALDEEAISALARSIGG